jgi:nucleoside-diphosphate-sugar epimerase
VAQAQGANVNLRVRVLLIGGSGFIGPFLSAEVERLGHEVFVFHRGRTHAVPAPREIFGDRRRLVDSAAKLRALAPDVVIDVILSSGRQARELMEVFAGAAGRVVALSSMDVYRACGLTHRLEEGPLEPLPLTESSALRTKLQTYPPAQVQMLQQIFGWLDDEYDKIPVEREIRAGSASLPATILRLPMVYGPGDPLRRFHPIVKRVTDGRRAIIVSEKMASWRATKGYVENVAAAIALAAVSDRAAGRTYNVGEIDTLSELEWTRRIADVLGFAGELVLLPDDRVPPYLRAPGNTDQQWVADTARLREELGFQERVPRDEAIRRTVEWERAHPPSGFTPHQFDDAAEDAAIAS